MTDGDDLLRAVLDDPDDDMPRLIYADWLDEHGDPSRAEFIRVQIELKNMPTILSKDMRSRINQLEGREKTLFSLHFESWMEPLRQKGEPFQSRDAHGIFRRGFIDEVWMRSKTFLIRVYKLLRRVPCRILRLIQAKPDELNAVFRLEAITRFQDINLSAIAITPNHISALVEGVTDQGVQKMTFDASRIDRDLADLLLLSTTKWSRTEITLETPFSGILSNPSHFSHDTEFMSLIQSRVRKLNLVCTSTPSFAPPES